GLAGASVAAALRRMAPSQETAPPAVPPQLRGAVGSRHSEPSSYAAIHGDVPILFMTPWPVGSHAYHSIQLTECARLGGNAMGALDGKSVVITGGASGMGRSTAILAPKQGASVLLVDLNEAGLADACAEVQAAG